MCQHAIIVPFLLTLVCLAGVKSKEDPTKCCAPGNAKAAEGLLSDITCNADVSIYDKYEVGYIQNLCRMFYKQCCHTATQAFFCEIGKRLALSNQLCIPNLRTGGDKQKQCCECCKEGLVHGQKGGNCEEAFADGIFCEESFKTCCSTVEKPIGLPTTITTTKKTNETTKLDCSSIVCNKQTTTGCRDSSDGPKCLCRAGFSARDRITCEDINECDSNICLSTTKCVNTFGSFKCECPDELSMKDGVCTSNSENCLNGFQYNNGECKDIDECITGSHRCPSTLFCLNEQGDYRCLKYCTSPNYRIVQEGVCEDVNECHLGTAKCAINFECENIQGSYECKRVRCENGYKFVSGYCEDIDECEEDPQICGAMGICRNAYGRYYCDCQQGYSIHPVTKRCADTDECLIDRAYCNYNCINTEGSFRCTCPTGYETRGSYCYDVDECGSDPCPEEMFCFNNYGSYACINQSCPNKYFKQTSSQLNAIASCRKVDNCYDAKECENEKLHSVKRVAYKFRGRLNVRKFNFNYWTSFNKQFYKVTSGISQAPGFDIEELNEGKVRLYNTEEMIGPKSIHLVMVTNVTKHSGALTWQYEYHMYIFIAEHSFS